MPQFDVSTFSSQLFWLAVCWGIVFIYLWKFLTPKMSGKLSEREKRIQDLLGEAANFDLKTEEMLKEYDGRVGSFKLLQNERFLQVSTFIQSSKEDLEADLKQNMVVEVKNLEVELDAFQKKILKQLPSEFEVVLAQFIKQQLPEGVYVDENLKALLSKELKRLDGHD